MYANSRKKLYALVVGISIMVPTAHTMALPSVLHSAIVAGNITLFSSYLLFRWGEHNLTYSLRLQTERLKERTAEKEGLQARINKASNTENQGLFDDQAGGLSASEKAALEQQIKKLDLEIGHLTKSIEKSTNSPYLEASKKERREGTHFVGCITAAAFTASTLYFAYTMLKPSVSV